MKGLGSIMRERKEKDAQKQGQDIKTMQLGLIGLCRAITKQLRKLKVYGAQDVDIAVNERLVRAMVDTGVEANKKHKISLSNREAN